MKKYKKMIIAFGATIILIPVVFLIYIINIFGGSIASDNTIKEYMRETHGIEIVIIDTYFNSVFLGSDTYTAHPKNNDELIIHIKVTEEEAAQANFKEKYLITDNYIENKTELENYKKIHSESATFEEIGYELIENEDVHYSSFTFKSKTQLGDVGLDNELSNLFVFIEKLNDLDIINHSIEIHYGDEDDEKVFLNSDDVKELTTEEELLNTIKLNNWTWGSYYLNKDWEEEMNSLETSFFWFKSHPESFKTSFKFDCYQLNAKGDCENVFVNIHFDSTTLTEVNMPQATKELEAILDLFGNKINPDGTLEYGFIDEGDLNKDLPRIFRVNIDNYNSVSEFINTRLK